MIKTQKKLSTTHSTLLHHIPSNRFFFLKRNVIILNLQNQILITIIRKLYLKPTNRDLLITIHRDNKFIYRKKNQQKLWNITFNGVLHVFVRQ